MPRLGQRVLWVLFGLSAVAQAQTADLQVQSWSGGSASLVRGDYPDQDHSYFGPNSAGGRLSNGTLVPGAVREVAASHPFQVNLPIVCVEYWCVPAELVQGLGSTRTAVRADFGALGVAATASVSGITTDGLEHVAGGGSAVRLQAGAVASYTEVLSFASLSLPVGSPVSFTVFSAVHATLANPPTDMPSFRLTSELSVTYTPTVLRPATGLQFELTPFVWTARGAGEQVYGVQSRFDVQLGDLVTLEVKMHGAADVSIWEDGPVWPDNTPVSFSSGTSVSAMNSLNTGIVVNTPGVSLHTASGHVYAPVPEPATNVLLIAGALGLMLQRRAMGLSKVRTLR